MKRDWDLIRNILIAAEAAEFGHWITPEQFGEDDESEYLASHQIRILADAGLVYTPDNLDDNIIRLTWFGHEFLDQIRDDNVWKETKKTVLDKVTSAGIEIISSVATKIIEKQIGI